MGVNLYALLGVKPGATAEELKRAYRVKARELHPDRNPDDEEAEGRFKEATRAYEVLSHPERRRQYDEFGEVALQDGFDGERFRQYQAWQHRTGGVGTPPHGSVDEIFGGRETIPSPGIADLVGSVVGRRGKGPDVVATVAISFVESLRGTEREVRFRVPGGDRRPRKLKVKIPPGVTDGGKVRLRGQGGRVRGRPPGDVVITVQVAAHSHFRREGLDLHIAVPVTLGEAYNGATVDVPTVDGRLDVRVPAGTRSGSRLRVAGKGIKAPSGAPGDLIVHIEVCLPPPGNKECGRLLRQADEAYPRPLRGPIVL